MLQIYQKLGRGIVQLELATARCDGFGHHSLRERHSLAFYMYGIVAVIPSLAIFSRLPYGNSAFSYITKLLPWLLIQTHVFLLALLSFEDIEVHYNRIRHRQISRPPLLLPFATPMLLSIASVHCWLGWSEVSELRFFLTAALPFVITLATAPSLWNAGSRDHIDAVRTQLWLASYLVLKAGHLATVCLESLLEGLDTLPSNTIKLALESLTGYQWDWWPLSRPIYPIDITQSRLQWYCVSTRISKLHVPRLTL